MSLSLHSKVESSSHYSSSPLDSQEVRLSPCDHRVKEFAARRLYGPTENSICTTQNQPCLLPGCREIIVGYVPVSQVNIQVLSPDSLSVSLERMQLEPKQDEVTSHPGFSDACRTYALRNLSPPINSFSGTYKHALWEKTSANIKLWLDAAHVLHPESFCYMLTKVGNSRNKCMFSSVCSTNQRSSYHLVYNKENKQWYNDSDKMTEGFISLEDLVTSVINKAKGSEETVIPIASLNDSQVCSVVLEGTEKSIDNLPAFLLKSFSGYCKNALELEDGVIRILPEYCEDEQLVQLWMDGITGKYVELFHMCPLRLEKAKLVADHLICPKFSALLAVKILCRLNEHPTYQGLFLPTPRNMSQHVVTCEALEGKQVGILKHSMSIDDQRKGIMRCSFFYIEEGKVQEAVIQASLEGQGLFHHVRRDEKNSLIRTYPSISAIVEDLSNKRRDPPIEKNCARRFYNRYTTTTSLEVKLTNETCIIL